MILDIRNANRNFEAERSERPDFDQESAAPKHAGFAGPRQDRSRVLLPGDEPHYIGFMHWAASATHLTVVEAQIEFGIGGRAIMFLSGRIAFGGPPFSSEDDATVGGG